MSVVDTVACGMAERREHWRPGLAILVVLIAGAAPAARVWGCEACLANPFAGDGQTYDLEGLDPTSDDELAPAFRLDSRWSVTATDKPNTGARGTPVTLTWGLVTDGNSLPTGVGEPSSPSNLIAFLDSVRGSGPGGTDLTQRPWFGLFQQSFNRWSELSGLTFIHEPADDGRTISSGNVGVLGTRADIRIGGHSIDGASNILAYNYYPNYGDMVIDTDESSLWSSTSNNSRAVRNILMHELGHGLGIRHMESSNANFLMEPFLSTSFDGPQFDDILAVQRYYGDRLEAGGGNDTLATPTYAQAFTQSSSWAVGIHASNTTVVTPTQWDFVSIDGLSDIDVYQFTVTAPTSFDAVLTPVGPTYNEGAQGGTQSPLNTAALNDLILEILAADGSVLSYHNSYGLGYAESVLGLSLGPGDYFARVSGTNDNIQMYQLSLIASILAAIAGDFNGDGVVNADDLDLVLGYWGSDIVPDQWVNFIPSGIVSANELDAVLGNWGNTADAMAQVASITATTGLSETQVVSMIVPEPTTVTLLAGSSVIVFLRRRVVARV